MGDSGAEFPGFQTCVHKDEYEYRRALSRLQRRAPRPLQIKPNAPLECNAASKAMGCNNTTTITSSSSSSSLASVSSYSTFYHSKDPIPLLSPLVLPSLLESAFAQEGNAAKSH